TFHLHSDACYGGYAAADTWSADGTRRRADAIRAATASDWPTEEWVQSIVALGWTDSVSIDPHKLGYVPYPAGAILLRDRRARQLVAVDPPYLAPADQADAADERVLGRYIFEGSKPGAAAAAVWLSHKVLPLDERGYGYLIEQTVLGARRLHAALRTAALDPFRVVLLPEPDINIVNYVVTHPALATLEMLNRFNERVYLELSLSRTGAAPEYIVTRTRFQSPMYDGAVAELLAEAGVAHEAWRASGAAGLVVLRSTVMDPFLIAPPPAPDHVAGYVAALRRACEAVSREQ
ncbi:MAG TPA: hypothetical protein VFU46_08810, partial [Gemmatimonadales bacterium]|nr:hypothetical protein [Gemmatimonadales bacterium]